MKWEYGRQGTGYRKLKLFISEWLRADAYILHLPAGSYAPPHTDYVPFAEHHRVNITLRGDVWMGTPSAAKVFRLGRWFSYFRPDITDHWTVPVVKDTYILSIGWCRTGGMA